MCGVGAGRASRQQSVLMYWMALKWFPSYDEAAFIHYLPHLSALYCREAANK